MSIVMQINPFEFFVDADGTPLDDGYIWVGEANKDPRNYPAVAYYDEALTIPAAMPLRTTNGYIYRNGSPAFLYINGNYSILVQDKRSRQVYYVANFLLIGSGSAVSSGDLANDTDLSLGVSLVGRAVSTVDSVFALLSAPQKAKSAVIVASYHPGWGATAKGAIGGGIFIWNPVRLKSAHDGGSVISPTVPWDGTQGGLAAFLAGSGETNPGGSGCFERLIDRYDVFMFGAKGNNADNDIFAFQKAMDSIKTPFVPNSTYSLTGTLNFNFDGVTLYGESMKLTILNFTGATLTFSNPLFNTVTRLFCGISDLQISQPGNLGSFVVNWGSMQFGRLHKVWILGNPILGCTAINMSAVWTVTECTYNVVEECYIGNCATGIAMGDGANNNNIIHNRLQIGVAGGSGITLSGTAIGRISSNNILGNGFEYPGNISNGITVLQNVNGLWIKGNRFEQMLNGIILGSLGNVNVNGINRVDNYFDSCTTNLNITAGARSGVPAMIASGSYTGVGSLVETGVAYGMTGTRTGVGAYVFTYLDTTYPDASQEIVVTSGLPFTVVAPIATGFSVVTQNAAGVATDAARIGITVMYNR